jgi:hypothetical protein
MTRDQALALLKALDAQCRTQPYPPGLYLYGPGNRAEEMIDVVVQFMDANSPEAQR